MECDFWYVKSLYKFILEYRPYFIIQGHFQSVKDG